MVKQAEGKDIVIIEEILFDAVKWMHRMNLENKWNEDNIKWERLSNQYKITDFYIDYEENIPAGCMVLTQYDQQNWPEIVDGESLYIHKLAIKREFAGRKISDELINYAKSTAELYHIKTIRLNCNKSRKKLRELYERQGFICVSEKVEADGYGVAFYRYDVKR